MNNSLKVLINEMWSQRSSASSQDIKNHYDNVWIVYLWRYSPFLGVEYQVVVKFCIWLINLINQTSCDQWIEYCNQINFFNMKDDSENHPSNVLKRIDCAWVSMSTRSNTCWNKNLMNCILCNLIFEYQYFWTALNRIMRKL